MKIERTKHDKIIKISERLLLIAIILYCLAAFLYILVIAFQKVLIHSVLNYNEKLFIFPVINVFTFVTIFGLFLLFALMIIKKNVRRNKSIGLELAGFIVLILMSTVFNRVMNTIGQIALRSKDIEYIIWNNGLLKCLDIATFILPFAYLLFYIGTSMKMVISILNPVDEEIVD